MKVKIIGAGSIGNHLAQASRRIGWNVSVVDRDPSALRRMKEEIYPTRYGVWDDSIKLYESGKEPLGGFDVIFIGTPPYVRLPLALQAIKEKPKVLQLEKPLSSPALFGLKKALVLAKKNKVAIVMGYDHALAPSISFVVGLLKKKHIGEVLTLDVEFREHWGGIFKAHPWLKGPEDSYLGFREKGGGASGEHSHALHLWQFLAGVSGMGVWKKMAFAYHIIKDTKVDYDSIASFTFITDKGKVGRVVQDVVTSPTRKWARLQGTEGFIEWHCNGHERGDVVRWKGKGDDKVGEKIFDKKRPDDFYAEVLHIRDILEKKLKPSDSPVSLEGGVRVMEVLSTAHKNREKSLTPIKKI